jgi:dTMP kinase
VTVPTPVVTPTNASGGPVDETAVLPPVRPEGPDAETTTELPQPPVPDGAADETTVLRKPPVPDGAADDTTVLPAVREDGAVPARGGRGSEPGVGPGGPADRIPPGFFRDERSAPGGPEDRTRELPQVDAEGFPRRRPRPDWAEETPLDDLPTLADELLGPREDYEADAADDSRDDGRGGGRGGRGRGRGGRWR